MDLDPRLLRVLALVEETSSVTTSAEILGMTQSAVSHLVRKLRGIFGDPLFVKSGRGVRPTPRAKLLAQKARELLRQMEQFAKPEIFDPGQWRANFTIAANDFQRDALLPGLLALLRFEAPHVTLRIIPSNVPTLEMLRDDHCQLIVSPRPPGGSDAMQIKLFEDSYRVFYDPEIRDAPATKADYLAADHATVVYEPQRPLDLDAHFAARGLHRRFVVAAPGFAALTAFLRGGDLLATAPGLLRFGTFSGLASAPVPLPCPKMPMFMIWSRRLHDDPAHKWLRGRLRGCARKLVASAT